MRECEQEKGAAFSRGVVVCDNGSMIALCGYGHAVRRLHEYESSGVLPEDAGTGRRRTNWERYTMKAPDGEVHPRRGWECVLGRLQSYERFGLTPSLWQAQYGAAAASEHGVE